MDEFDVPEEKLPRWMLPFERLINILPELKTKVQITGLVALIGGILLAGIRQTTDLRAYIAAGGMGLLLVFLGQLFPYLEDIPQKHRFKYLIAIYFGLMTFIVIMFVLVSIFLDTTIKQHPLESKLRLLQRGDPDLDLCQARPNGAVVQIFERGWMIADFLEHKVYAISVRSNGNNLPFAPNEIQSVDWISFPSQRTNPDNPHEGKCRELSESENSLLIFNIRAIYCSSTTSDARDMLGKPKTNELLTWTQFQKNNAGLLIAGIPAAEAQRESGLFLWMSAAFLERSDSRPFSGEGRAYTFTANDVGGDLPCMALWRPASSNRIGQPDPTSEYHPPSAQSCSAYIEPPAYIKGGQRCRLFH